ncbi:glycosyltransferase [Pelagicoccus enzymogenes]|uniref:glycosyltransferase n=1 Tax=Pelagicoccus enzymogenes TaxID=2773457 RepID=UPI00280DE2E5|nr:glycosyltransferase [Pelagicoccus enzymogenes]MDQ8201083.1 glycosyltransferase [Pelagicoccus enzymogenes]
MPGPKLSVIIPAHNEASTIRKVVDALCSTEIASEILIVDDGSTDQTYAELEKIRQDRSTLVRILKHNTKSGKGAAIKTALEHVTGDVVAIQDADLEYDPKDLPKLLEPFQSSDTTVVYGSRILGNNPRSNNRFYWGGRFLSFVTSLLYQTRITDEATGYKLFRTETLRSLKLESDGFEFCPEVTAKLLRGGHKIIELPINYRPRSFSEGKKIRWYHGLTAISTLLSIRLAPPSGKYSSSVSTFLSVALLSIFVLSAWNNIYKAPFVLDDLGSIRDNQTIKEPFSLSSALQPPHSQGETVGGRPLLNLSLAANYQISGLAPWSYHATDIFIHLLCALTLLGLVRRSIDIWEAHRNKLPFNRDSVATLAALLWAVHPLATAAVSYTAQRAESLLALCYLFVLYAAARSIRSSRPYLWTSASVIACFIGTGVKEVIATAPLAVILFDYVFLSERNLKLQLKRRSLFYLFLFLSWIPLALLMQSTSGRGGTAGLSFGADSWEYLKTQAWALVHYLRLTLWPDPLVFDYGRQFLVDEPTKWIPRAILLAVLLIVSLFGFIRRNPFGMLGLLCFIFLAPTSSFIPIADRVFEHRFYLPLAAVCVVFVVSISILSRRLALAFVLAVSVAGVYAILDRNETYNNSVSLWKDTVAKVPSNSRAHNNLATLLVEKGEYADAIRHFEKALELSPDALLYHNFANTLALEGKREEAITAYLEAIKRDPLLSRARLGLADTYLATGQAGPSIQHYKKFLADNPEYVAARRKLATAYLAIGDRENALAEFAYIVELRPDDAQAHFDHGDVLAQNQKLEAAIEAFERVIELDANNSQAYGNLGNLYLMRKDFAQAEEQYTQSLSIKPTAMIHTNLAIVHLYTRRAKTAKSELQKALQLDPEYVPAKNLLKKLN